MRIHHHHLFLHTMCSLLVSPRELSKQTLLLFLCVVALQNKRSYYYTKTYVFFFERRVRRDGERPMFLNVVGVLLFFLCCLMRIFDECDFEQGKTERGGKKQTGRGKQKREKKKVFFWSRRKEREESLPPKLANFSSRHNKSEFSHQFSLSLSR